jgi:L-fuculose-phosphate aldolase
MGRQDNILNELVKTGRRIVKSGLVISSGGNISARHGSLIYIKRKGVGLDSDRKDYVCVDIKTGKCLDGVPSVERQMHMACYKRRDDINAVVHLHPVFSTAVANSHIKLGPISYELLSCLGSGLCRARYKPSGSAALAGEISSLIGRHNAILMPNHGILVVAKTLGQAYQRAHSCERACQLLVFSRLLGAYSFLPKKEAKRIISLYGR